MGSVVSRDAVEREVRQWLEQVVIGLNLCPFAGAPYRDGLVRISITAADSEAGLLTELRKELELLDARPARSVETTLLVLTGMFSDFLDFNDFLYEAESLLDAGGWEGIYQLASFHPKYRFADTKATAASNLTNRSPWPILHIIREASMDQVLENYPDPDAIPARNIQKMQSLTPAQRRELFPWLFRASK